VASEILAGAVAGILVASFGLMFGLDKLRKEVVRTNVLLGRILQRLDERA